MALYNILQILMMRYQVHCYNNISAGIVPGVANGEGLCNIFETSTNCPIWKYPTLLILFCVCP